MSQYEATARVWASLTSDISPASDPTFLTTLNCESNNKKTRANDTRVIDYRRPDARSSSNVVKVFFGLWRSVMLRSIQSMTAPLCTTHFITRNHDRVRIPPVFSCAKYKEVQCKKEKPYMQCRNDNLIDLVYMLRKYTIHLLKTINERRLASFLATVHVVLAFKANLHWGRVRSSRARFFVLLRPEVAVHERRITWRNKTNKGLRLATPQCRLTFAAKCCQCSKSLGQPHTCIFEKIFLLRPTALTLTMRLKKSQMSF